MQKLRRGSNSMPLIHTKWSLQFIVEIYFDKLCNRHTYIWLPPFKVYYQICCSDPSGFLLCQHWYADRGKYVITHHSNTKYISVNHGSFYNTWYLWSEHSEAQISKLFILQRGKHSVTRRDGPEQTICQFHHWWHLSSFWTTFKIIIEISLYNYSQWRPFILAFLNLHFLPLLLNVVWHLLVLTR